MLELLLEAQRRHLLRPLDVQFAHMLAGDEPYLLLAAACLSNHAGAGHVCLPLEQLQGDRLFDGRDPVLARQIMQLLGSPNVERWRSELQRCEPVDDGHRPTPLVLERDMLYLQRSWRNECQVAHFIANGQLTTDMDERHIRQVLDTLFPTVEKEVDWQKIAAAVALTSRMAVISGGPGTGKTTTVAKLLAALIALRGDAQPLRIQLAAPTGKAAARLTESLGVALRQLTLSEAQLRSFPQAACTLHRLLGAMPDSQQLRHHRDNPLHLDLLVVDEASMVDLPMMAHVMAALPAHARVIFLGDRDQLASVEAGAVLGDICHFTGQGYSPARTEQLQRLTGCALPPPSPKASSVADSICLLRKSYRFAASSGIGLLAQAVNQGDERRVKDVWHGGYSDVGCHPLREASDYQQLLTLAVTEYRRYLQAIDDGAEPAVVLRAFQQFRLLCALREGPFGVEGLNQGIEQALRSARLIPALPANGSRWYVGRPVMIARNDTILGLFNGDIGIALLNAQGELRVCFPLPDGSVKPVPPSRLPPHETAFVMTVHKSQGSEFEHTALVLPNMMLPLLTRELIYTAITRARQQLSIFADEDILCQSVCAATRRYSGLAQRILMLAQ
ncbi:exodeoxyribonuclease V subunit alpha [Musicola paradisiaca]|uniref:RecBCD enzyme subunit RecD n=1 Tax=Musicola paradisiaca (strain Ech703) TaxID=579405 RepID=C6CC21_MUSP7|nr:exodeoxyribonuclease V subunit alpha [Musicola paradisiaca]ACS86781.1 exodeoxyribonuclease V, alpha subunit [Musicola paradisiaca Ech703]